ncbi:MAG: hypothetical protein ACRC7D_14895 [Aeromonas popoffii]
MSPPGIQGCQAVAGFDEESGQADNKKTAAGSTPTGQSAQEAMT